MFDANEELYIEYNKLKAEVDKLEKSVGTPCTRTTQPQQENHDDLTPSITKAVRGVQQNLGTLQSSVLTAVYSTAKDSENEEEKTSLCNSFKDNRYRMNLIVDASHNVARSERLKDYALYFMTRENYLVVSKDAP